MGVVDKVKNVGVRGVMVRLIMMKVQFIRRCCFFFFNDIRSLASKAKLNQPAVFSGKGEIKIGKSSIGYHQSPGFLSGYSYFEARNEGAKIIVGDQVFFNNGATLIADKTSITIGDRCLIGPEFCVFDSDFHGLHPQTRTSGDHPCAPVEIGENVFIGNRVTILKGVKIGKNSVIGSGAIVTKDIPANVIASGNPAVVIKQLEGA